MFLPLLSAYRVAQDLVEQMFSNLSKDIMDFDFLVNDSEKDFFGG